MKCDKLVYVGRSQPIRGSATVAAGAASLTMAGGKAKAAPANARVDTSSNRLANLADLKVGQPVDIEYPDA